MDIVDIRANMPNYEVYRDWQRPDSIESILIHHSGAGTVNGQGKPNMLLRDMAKRHVHEEGRAHVGYHYAINPAGRVFYLLDEQIAGYHVALPAPASSNQAAMRRWKSDWLSGQYFNRRSIGIVLLGWFDTNRHQNGRRIPDNNTTTPPDAQWQALVELLRDVSERHNVDVTRIEGHREALVRAGFGQTTCPGLQFDLAKLRADVRGQAVAKEGATTPLISSPGLPTLPTAEDGSLIIPGPAPALTFTKNRPLIGLHARNAHTFTSTDWQIIRQARIESLKMMSFTYDTVYAQARRINPNMEFIVRLYAGSPGRGNMPSPQQFADQFQDTINNLYQKFGVLKFEIHNEPNHPSGLEGWGTTQADALAFQRWYKQTFSILKKRHKWALFGYPGLAIPHNDLEWLDWNREAIEMSDWLGMHCYWQTPPGFRNNFMSDFWGRRFKAYHEKHPNKLIEITEFGNSNGQNPALSLSRSEQRRQYEAWLRQTARFEYIGSAHSFIATSPDPRWEREGFAWGHASGPFEVASAVGAITRAARRPDWHYSSAINLPAQLPPDSALTFPLTIGNSGRLPWIKDGDGRSSIRVRWVDGNNRPVGKASWSRLPHDLAPGGRAELEMKINTPSEEGSYQLQVALYHSGQRKWFHQLNPEQSINSFATTIAHATRDLPGEVEWPDLMASYSILAAPGRGVAKSNALVEVEVRNDGARRWVTDGEQEGSIRLGYHWINAQGQRVEGRGRGELSHPVSHGESIRIVMPLRYPDEAGTYTLQIGMVSELERWFAEKIDHTIELRPPSALYAVAYQAENLSHISVGTKRELAVQLHNVGGRTWLSSGDAPITVVHEWLNEQGYRVQPTLRVLLPRDVPPNEQVTVKLPLLAPAKAGMYELQIDMAEEGHLFFSQQGNSPLRQQIRVDAAQGAPEWSAQWLLVDVPDVLTVQQNAQINVHLRNVGQRTWSRQEVRLAYRWPNGQARRVQLPVDVLPGSEMALGLPITPSTLGQHKLTLDLWHDRLGWLKVTSEPEEINVLPLNRPLNVLSQTATDPITTLVEDQAFPDEDMSAFLAEDDALSTEQAQAPAWQQPLPADEPSSIPQEASWQEQQPLPADEPPSMPQDASWQQSLPTDEPPSMPQDASWQEQEPAADPSSMPQDASLAQMAGDAQLIDDAQQDPSVLAEMTSEPEQHEGTPAPSDDRSNLTSVADDLTDDPLNYQNLTPIRPPVESTSAKPSQPTTAPSTANRQMTATASHHPERAKLALDYHKITGWSSEVPQEPGMWFLIDLGHIQTVSSLRLLSQPEQFPRGYILEGSQDGQSWHTLHQVPENWSDIALQLPVPHRLRYLRFTQTNHNPWQQPWSVREVRIE